MTKNKNIKNNQCLGGGAMPKNPLFKPLIASSLALALGVSVAVATDPKITYDNDGSNGKTPIAIDSSWNWKGNATSTGGTGDFLSPQKSDNSAITNLSFVFDKLTDPSNTPTQTIASSDSVNTLTIKADGNVAGNNAILTFSNASTSKGLLLGTGTADANRGTLTFDFLGSDQTSNANWNNSNGTHIRKMVLNLTDTTSYTPTDGEAQNVSLIGNLVIKAGKGIIGDVSGDNRPVIGTTTNVFEATLGGNMIGNITINPSDIKEDAQKITTGYRDIQTTFVFNDGVSLQGNITSNTGSNTFTFLNGSIVGSISANNGYPSNNKDWIIGSENEYLGGINKITFSGQSGSITGDIIADNSGQNLITFNTSADFQGNILSGQITSKETSNVNHNNFIVFKGSLATIQQNSTIQTVQTASEFGGTGKFSNNIILFSNSTTASVNFSSMLVSGDYTSTNPTNKTFNLVDFEGSGNTLNIDSISSTQGNNIIAKGLVSDVAKTGFTTTLNSVYYNDALFEINIETQVAGYHIKGAGLKNGIVAKFVKTDYSAQGNFTFGSNNTSNAISTAIDGSNYINISGTTTIKGNILSSVKDSGGPTSGHNNILVFTGTSTTLGTTSNKISITVDNNGGHLHNRNSINAILLGASTTNLYLSQITALGTYNSETAKNLNILSLNSTSTSNINLVNSNYGSNIIAKDLISQNTSSGYNTTLFGNANNAVIQSGFISEFVKTTHSATGTFVFGVNDSDVSNSIYAQGASANYINISGTTTIKGNINASEGGVGNVLVLTGTSATLGESGKEISIISNNPSSGFGRTASNTILLGANTNTLNISNLSVRGDYKVGANPSIYTFNILSFNNTGDTGGKSITSISATSGNNVIGKDLITQSSGYNATLFGNVNSPSIQSNFDTNFMANTYTAKGTFTLGTITANDKGTNYINVETLNTSSITANDGGTNYIYVGSTTNNGSLGKISASGSGTNNITANGGTYTITGLSTKGNSGISGNTLNLGNATLTINTRTGDTDTDTNDKAIYTWNGGNNNIIAAQTINVNGNIVAGGGISSSKSSNSLSGITMSVTGNISGNADNTNNFTFTADNGTLTLKGTTSQISTLTAVSGNATNKDTLILDTTNNNNATSIDKVVNGSNLIVNVKGSTNSATLTFNNSSTDSTIKALALTEISSSADKNILNLQARTTTILDEVNVSSGKGLTINLNGTSTILELDNGLSNSGNAKISFEGSNGVFDGVIDTSGSNATTTINIANNQAGTITGDIAQDNNGANNAVFNGGTAKLTLQGSSNTLSLVDTTNTGTLSLNSNNASTTTISQLKSNNLTANFGGTDKATKLVIVDSDDSSKTITLAGVTLENNSTNNTLDLTSLSSATISSAVNVTSTQGLTIALGSTDMIFGDGLSGNSVLSVSGTSSFTTTSNNIEANSLNLVGDASAKATFKNTTTTLSTLNANAKGGNTLALDTSNNNDVAVTLSNALNGVLSIELNGSASNSTSLTLNGGTIQGIKATNGGSNLVIFSSGNNTINNAIDSNSVANSKGLALQVNSGATLYAKGNLDNSNGGILNLTLTDSTLSLGGENNKISSLVASGKTLVDLARVDSEGNALTRSGRAMKTLEIGVNSGSGFKGDATFEVYVGGGQADKVVFSAVEQNNGEKSNATLVASGGLYGVLNGGGTLLASVADSEKNDIAISGGERLIGGVVVKTELESKEENGNTNYYLKQGEDLGAPIQYQEVASSALTVNYDLFLANFNSLNKRMGELRDDANSNGVWARVFGGAMSNDFGAGSKTEYITAQAGYDYALSVGNDARNFTGIAVAYGTSNTQGNTLSMNGLLGSSGSISLNEVDSHMVEVGIYNTFISDSGWYNDTIFKFDYIMSKFSLSNKTDLFTDTSNFAMVLSDEFGYRYKFGENEKGSWYIDPQLELAFGYFNQSDFNRAMYDTAGLYQSTMQATQDTILTLRTRVGASLGKKFNTDKGFASVYVGAFYEYDYINGGNASVQGRVGGTTISLDSLESNGRAMLNIGSNIELTKGARLYIDVEKSFGDKQRTFMQFNLGARYSF